MDKRSFFFKNVKIESCKISEGLFVGVPSLTALSGFGKFFAIKLAQGLGLSAQELDLEGVALAFEDYQRVETPIRAINSTKTSKGLGIQFLPLMTAHFTAHLYFEIKANTPAAKEALFAAEHKEISLKSLMSCKFAQGNVAGRPRLIDLDSPRYDRAGPSKAARFLSALPSTALVMRDASDLIQVMREEEMDLMQGLVNAALPPAKRVEPYKSLFDDVQEGLSLLCPVAMGFTYLEKTPSGYCSRNGLDSRADTKAEMPPFVTSTAYGLLRLQTAASIRLSVNPNDPDLDPRPACVVFREVDCDSGVYVRSTETLT